MVKAYCVTFTVTSELSSRTSLPAAQVEPYPRCRPGIFPLLERAVLQPTQPSFLMLGGDRRSLVSERMVFPKTEGKLLGPLRLQGAPRKDSVKTC